ncbi:MAG: ribonuclease J [Candidatus Chisholmbacteria bacterium]|nr:ribonuclease J [Candidatus Chisholmbacteria bacterium]
MTVTSPKPQFASPSQIRLIPLGGIGTVTKNMYAYEVGDEILIVDCGIGFPDSTMLGVDLLVPDVSYLEARKNKIAGLLLTHGHDDHLAGLPYVLPKLGNIPIYASKLTRGFALDRLKEYSLPANITEIDERPFSVGSFTITPIKITHSVPDGRHFAIRSSVGTIYHGSDFKFDDHPVDGVLTEKDKIASLGHEGILCLLSDCLRSEKEGRSLSESMLTDTFRREIKDAQGKFIVTIMSSNVHRIQQAVNVMAEHGRRIAFVGRSVESNVKTAVNLGFLKLPQKMIINKRQIKHLPPRQVGIIIAGSQGQEGSSLTRAVASDHKDIQIKPPDKVVFSADPIPGNETPVYSLIDDLSRLGIDVAYSDVDDQLHVSGHAYRDEQKDLIALTRPKFLIPIGGSFRHMVQYRKMAESLGFPRHHIALLENGQVVRLTQESLTLAETIPLRNIMVDGLGIGDVGTIVLRDRQTMAEDGIVVVVVPISQQTGKIKGTVEIISRGFVFMKQSRHLVKKMATTVKASLKPGRVLEDWAIVRQQIERSLEKLLYKETQRQPLILTVIMEV